MASHRFAARRCLSWSFATELGCPRQVRLPRLPDIFRAGWHVRKVPILLQKSFWGDARNFSGPLMRFARGDMRDHVIPHKNDHGASHRRYGVLQWRSRLKINFCEIFGVIGFSTFAARRTGWSRPMWSILSTTGFVPRAARSWSPAISAKTRLAPEAGAELPGAEALPEISNGSVELWLKPADCAGDAFDEVSDLRASMADDTAPRANIMERTPTMPHSAAFHFHKGWISKRRASAKNSTK
jgi:hypothetical protein